VHLNEGIHQHQPQPESLGTVVDGDITFSEELGIAVQTDLHSAVAVPYDLDYFQKYQRYENSPIARAINRGRIKLVQKYCGQSAIIDIGIGSGEFLRVNDQTRGAHAAYGFDVNPYAVELLNEENRFINPYLGIPEVFGGMTCWDSLEHLRNPDVLVKCLHPGQHLFLSLPIFFDLRRIRESKHYRPNEHFYYFTERGLVRWLREFGFELLERSTFEIVAGREDIYSYAFQRSSRLIA
jgi:SAM-dependent methyltransferase